MSFDVNIGEGVLPTFYIFKRKKLCDNYIKELQTIELYGNAKKNMDDFILVQRVPILFQKVRFGENISTQLSSFNLRWPWSTGHIKGYIINIVI
jgi:hypothetical protein